MPEARVRGVTLNYEIIGDRGDFITLTPGSRRSYDELVPFGKLLAVQGYRVLLHDRRNCGRSEVGIEARGSEHEIWADDLDELCKHLATGRSMPAARRPVHAWRCSCAASSIVGQRPVALARHRRPARCAKARTSILWLVHGTGETGGMAAVCGSEHFGGCIEARPSNRDRLMAMKPEEFIGVMNSWRENFSPPPICPSSAPPRSNCAA